jgi:emp24/gp25L/p24 family/GOLD
MSADSQQFHEWQVLSHQLDMIPCSPRHSHLSHRRRTLRITASSSAGIRTCSLWEHFPFLFVLLLLPFLASGKAPSMSIMIPLDPHDEECMLLRIPARWKAQRILALSYAILTEDPPLTEREEARGIQRSYNDVTLFIMNQREEIFFTSESDINRRHDNIFIPLDPGAKYWICIQNDHVHHYGANAWKPRGIYINTTEDKTIPVNEGGIYDPVPEDQPRGQQQPRDGRDTRTQDEYDESLLSPLVVRMVGIQYSLEIGAPIPGYELLDADSKHVQVRDLAEAHSVSWTQTATTVSSYLQSLTSHYHYSRQRETQHRSLVERTFVDLFFWTAVQVLSVILVAALQIIYYKRYLDTASSTPSTPTSMLSPNQYQAFKFK